MERVSGITDAGLTTLQTFPVLRVLKLSNTNITDAGLVILQSFPALEWLYLANTKTTDDAVEALKQARPGLKVTR